MAEDGTFDLPHQEGSRCSSSRERAKLEKILGGIKEHDQPAGR